MLSPIPFKCVNFYATDHIGISFFLLVVSAGKDEAQGYKPPADGVLQREVPWSITEEPHFTHSSE